MVTNTMTINKIVDIFKEWAEAKSPFINDFGFGPIWDFGTSRQMKYPCMWVDLETSSNINITNRKMIPEFNLIVMFLDKENIQDNVDNTNGMRSNNVGHIMSDMFQVGQDFINDLILSYANSGFSLVNTVTANKVYDETTDKVYGWAFNFTMQTSIITCKDSSIVPPTTCLPANFVNSNGTYEQIINSGSIYVSDNITVTLGDGDHTFPSNVNISLPNYNVIINPSPDNYIPGTLQLPWNSNSANVDISVDGEVTKTADDNMWNGGADFIIEKNGNFELHFKLIGDNLMAGIEYFKANSQFNYNGIDMCFYRSSTNCFIFENGDNIYFYPSVINDNTQYSIVRQGNFIFYKIDGTTVRTQSIINTGKMYFTNSIYTLGAQVIDINIDL